MCVCIWLWVFELLSGIRAGWFKNLEKILSVEVRLDWHPRASGGHPPGFLPSSEGLGLLHGIWGAHLKGNADGARGILDNAGRGSTTIKRPCATLARLVGRSTNTVYVVMVIWFNDISASDGYLIPNPVYTYIIYDFKWIVCR